jgi:hypothetical protein
MDELERWALARDQGVTFSSVATMFDAEKARIARVHVAHCGFMVFFEGGRWRGVVADVGGSEPDEEIAAHGDTPLEALKAVIRAIALESDEISGWWLSKAAQLWDALNG